MRSILGPLSFFVFTFRDLFSESFFLVPCSFYHERRRGAPLAFGVLSMYIAYVCTRYLPATQRQVGRDGRARAIGREKYGSDRDTVVRGVTAYKRVGMLLLVVDLLMLLLFLMLYQSMAILLLLMLLLFMYYCSCCRCCSWCCNCRRRCCAFINFCFHMADIFLLTKCVFFFLSVFVSFLLDFLFEGEGPLCLL